jgi:RHS repeat-associated protein
MGNAPESMIDPNGEAAQTDLETYTQYITVGPAMVVGDPYAEHNQGNGYEPPPDLEEMAAAGFESLAEDTKAIRLNAFETDRRIGTSLLMHVMEGDQIEMNVDNIYQDYNANDDTPIDGHTILDALVSTLQQGTGGSLNGESHDTKLVDRLLSNTNFAQFDNIIQDHTDTTRPRAYLNYIMFDENMNIISEKSGSFQVDGDGVWRTMGTNMPMPIDRNGYIAVYTESRTLMPLGPCTTCGDVFFDNLNVRVTSGKLKEETHYYPFGLPMKGMGTDVENPVLNRQKYQSNEYIKELGLNWMSFGARQYDPQLGRFLSIDPLADGQGQQIWSPYSAMGNAPESMIDPNGEAVIDMQAVSNHTTVEPIVEGMYRYDVREFDNSKSENSTAEETKNESDNNTNKEANENAGNNTGDNSAVSCVTNEPNTNDNKEMTNSSTDDCGEDGKVTTDGNNENQDHNTTENQNQQDNQDQTNNGVYTIGEYNETAKSGVPSPKVYFVNGKDSKENAYVIKEDDDGGSPILVPPGHVYVYPIEGAASTSHGVYKIPTGGSLYLDKNGFHPNSRYTNFIILFFDHGVKDDAWFQDRQNNNDMKWIRLRDAID